jgi:glutathione-regulated potassium-efflux system ancillary protein KefF
MAAPSDALPQAAATGVLVITAHPQLEHSRVNRRLMAIATGLQQSQPEAGIVVRDLYSLYPDYLIDVAAEQALLATAQLVVWQHPIHWYSMPPLMKLWLDDVFTFGWAYGPGGEALQGKDLWLVASTGGPEDSYRPDSYNRYFFDAFLPPYEQTAALCGMRFLPPLVLHGAHKTHDTDLAEHERIFAERLRTYPHWPEIDALDEDVLPCKVPLSARPAETENA